MSRCARCGEWGARFGCNLMPIDARYHEDCMASALADMRHDLDPPPICAHGQYVVGLFGRIVGGGAK